MTSPAAPQEPAGWTVVLPVKGGPDAKSRLGHPARGALAAAVALDTVAAAIGARLVRRVLVVTSDPAVAAAHRALGAEVVPDPGQGLAGALVAGAAAAADGRSSPCALLLADLPALRPADLDAALAACGRELAGGQAAGPGRAPGHGARRGRHRDGAARRRPPGGPAAGVRAGLGRGPTPPTPWC